MPEVLRFWLRQIQLATLVICPLFMRAVSIDIVQEYLRLPLTFGVDLTPMVLIHTTVQNGITYAHADLAGVILLHTVAHVDGPYIAFKAERYSRTDLAGLAVGMVL